jgi:hypothetical protein
MSESGTIDTKSGTMSGTKSGTKSGRSTSTAMVRFSGDPSETPLVTRILRAACEARREMAALECEAHEYRDPAIAEQGALRQGTQEALEALAAGKLSLDALSAAARKSLLRLLVVRTCDACNEPMPKDHWYSVSRWSHGGHGGHGAFLWSRFTCSPGCARVLRRAVVLGPS